MNAAQLREFLRDVPDLELLLRCAARSGSPRGHVRHGCGSCFKAWE